MSLRADEQALWVVVNEMARTVRAGDSQLSSDCHRKAAGAINRLFGIDLTMALPGWYDYLRSLQDIDEKRIENAKKTKEV